MLTIDKGYRYTLKNIPGDWVFFRNFAGDPTVHSKNKEVTPNFTIRLSDEDAAELNKDEFRLKVYTPNHEDAEPYTQMKCTMYLDGRDPVKVAIVDPRTNKGTPVKSKDVLRDLNKTDIQYITIQFVRSAPNGDDNLRTPRVKKLIIAALPDPLDEEYDIDWSSDPDIGESYEEADD